MRTIMYLLTALFVVGGAGSVIVIILTLIQDAQEIFVPDAPVESKTVASDPSLALTSRPAK